MAIRSEIVNSHAHAQERLIDGEAPALSKVVAVEIVDERISYWEEGLVPSSTVVYENRGAVIADPHLETLDGRRVNVLVPGHEYVYTYKVSFLQAVAGVRCGMMIRNITGIEVCGAATSAPTDPLPWMDAENEAVVRFRFRCLLAPGTYFLNAGVLGMINGAEAYLDRRIDVAMFRVMPVESRLATGLVDLDVIPQLVAVA